MISEEMLEEDAGIMRMLSLFVDMKRLKMEKRLMMEDGLEGDKGVDEETRTKGLIL